MDRENISKNSLPFKLAQTFQPSGSQPQAIVALNKGRPGKSVLIGVTGSGKTFTLANVVASQHKPVLVLSPNKTLAAQLYEEFSLFFPTNKVCYFVSYYDYYQPESYLPAQDIYIAKETKINTEIERLRIEATASIINRPDTIVIASVSAIYSLGNPWDYRHLTVRFNHGEILSRKDLVSQLVAIQYKRNDIDRQAGTFQVIGNTITLTLAYLHDRVRIELFGDQVATIELLDRQNNRVRRALDNIVIFPARHFVTTEKKLQSALEDIERDLIQEVPKLKDPLHAQRLKTRVSNDIDMLKEVGYCSGIENYSRYFDNRKQGEKPHCLLDFFDDDFLLIVDESHIAIPQLRGMYNGDKMRKKALVDFGFRLQSAFDNRPLRFDEIETYFNDVIFVSATPGEYEQRVSTNVVEQIVRPTGIIDPTVDVVKREGQIDHLVASIKQTAKNGFRTLVTVLTKKMAEELASYLEQKKIKVCYLHSDIKTPERSELLHKLRLGVFDCLVGINLLREGLDLPEVALVAIMDADIEGFLRNTRSLIQTIGRAARNAHGKVIFYADKITRSMREALDETKRRRMVQIAYNKDHGITPQTVKREVSQKISSLQQAIKDASKVGKKKKEHVPEDKTEREILIQNLKIEMKNAARDLDFERAIALRDRLLKLQKNEE